MVMGSIATPGAATAAVSYCETYCFDSVAAYHVVLTYNRGSSIGQVFTRLDCEPTIIVCSSLSASNSGQKKDNLAVALLGSSDHAPDIMSRLIHNGFYNNSHVRTTYRGLKFACDDEKIGDEDDVIPPGSKCSQIPTYSAGTSGSAMNVEKAECSNCKFLAKKIKTLEAKIKILEGTLEMERHPENHTIESAAILHELYNDMGKLGLE
ncbi:hypothetical protein Tco_0349214 [Tanacetum coccineum]